jgi:hypothetical protein
VQAAFSVGAFCVFVGFAFVGIFHCCGFSFGVLFRAFIWGIAGLRSAAGVVMMTELDLLKSILDAQQLEVNLLTSLVAGVGFVGGGLFLFMILHLMREKEF